MIYDLVISSELL